MTIEIFEDEEGYLPPPGDDSEIVASNLIEPQVYNNVFIHYDSNGKVHLISNVRSNEFSNFEIDINLINSFISGNRFYGDFDIEHFYNISKGIIVDNQNIEKSIKSETLLFNIEYNDLSSNEITIEHNSKEQTWKFFARSGLDEKLSIISKTEFFVCKKDDPHFLYSTYSFEPKLLINGPLEFKFKTDLEVELNNISLVTIKKFNSYGLKEIK
jgi:hypothetical protein